MLSSWPAHVLGKKIRHRSFHILKSWAGGGVYILDKKLSVSENLFNFLRMVLNDKLSCQRVV